MLEPERVVAEASEGRAQRACGALPERREGVSCSPVRSRLLLHKQYPIMETYHVIPRLLAYLQSLPMLLPNSDGVGVNIYTDETY